MHDSFTAIGGAVPMTLILLGEVAPGGVGTGLYSILLFATLTVFIAGLMVGRTPEFLGKSIGAREVKLATLGVLVMPVGFLVTVGLSSVLARRPGRPAQRRAARLQRDPLRVRLDLEQQRLGVRGPHRGDELLRLPARRGDGARPVPRDPARARPRRGAGARRGRARPSSGSMPTASPIFVGLLIGVILLVGALSFFPALALGPLTEALTGRLW